MQSTLSAFRPKIQYLVSLVVTVAAGMALLALSLFLLFMALGEHRVDLQYQNEGIKTQAKVVGYHYVESTKPAYAGDRPVLAYTDTNGKRHMHLATEYGAVGEYGKRTLPSRELTLTYLPSDPSKARVEDWYSSSVAVITFLGAMTLLGAMLALMATVAIYRDRGRVFGQPQASIATPALEVFSTDYVPNKIPMSKRTWHIFLFVLLLCYGALGLYLDVLYIPGKRGNGIHLHSHAAWIMYAAILCACANLISVVADHYDRRNNEVRYINFAFYAESAAWLLFFISLATGYALSEIN